MYINYKLLAAKNLETRVITDLLMIRQNKTEDLAEYIQSQINIDILNDYTAKGYITSIKPKKKSDTAYNLVRLSEKGEELLQMITIPQVTEGDIQMMDYLIKMYLNHEDTERTVGNKKKIAKYIAILRNHLNLNLHQFYYLCEYFLAEYPYTKLLEYIFFNSNKNRYGKFENSIEDSSLYQFYDTKKREVEWYWSQRMKAAE